MRQGPNYGMWYEDEGSKLPCVPVPLEIAHEWADMLTVNWHDNGDGTYTLTPSEKI